MRIRPHYTKDTPIHIYPHQTKVAITDITLVYMPDENGCVHTQRLIDVMEIGTLIDPQTLDVLEMDYAIVNTST